MKAQANRLVAARHQPEPFVTTKGFFHETLADELLTRDDGADMVLTALKSPRACNIALFTPVSDRLLYIRLMRSSD